MFEAGVTLALFHMSGQLYAYDSGLIPKESGIRGNAGQMGYNCQAGLS
jgi:hypothetical protein